MLPPVFIALLVQLHLNPVNIFYYLLPLVPKKVTPQSFELLRLQL
jgi:hypothetical protein